jgi:hypothetical protein
MTLLNDVRAAGFGAADDGFAAWHEPGTSLGPVVFHRCAQGRPRHHEVESKAAVAEALAGWMGRDYAGHYDPVRRYAGRLFLVPSETLVAGDLPSGFDLATADLLGGVVPHAFVATKVISHGLVDPAADVPAGWSHDFADRVAGSVLPGFSAFARRDALRAGERLLAVGPVRLKLPDGVGGRGQQVVTDRRGLVAAIDAMDPESLARDGLALERDLAAVTTASVGRLQVGDAVVTYCGTQSLTRAHDGGDVYGGSRLLVARGDWDRLLALELPAAMRTAVAQARCYHAAAHDCYDGLVASRSNYDVAQGIDRATGGWVSGVLEQSWRIGGASGAEVVALLALQADPALASVATEGVERYGAQHRAPPGALVLFAGTDPDCGPLLKYARVLDDAGR